MVLDAKNGNKLQDVDELARNNILVTTFEKLWNWSAPVLLAFKLWL